MLLHVNQLISELDYMRNEFSKIEKDAEERFNH